MAEDLFVVEAGDEADGAGSIVLNVRVQPGAGRAAVTGRYGDALALRVAAPPVDGRANTAVVDFVAELFGVPASRVELVSGARGRAKRLRVADVDGARAREVLERELAKVQSGTGGARGGRGRR